MPISRRVGLLAAPDFPDQPHHGEDDGEDPQHMKEDAGDGEGDAEDHPEDQQENGENEEFAHNRTIGGMEGMANGIMK